MKKPYWDRGCNWNINDKTPSPVDGYWNMSHWTRDLSAIRATVPFYVRCPEKVFQFLETSIKICKDQPRPYVDMLYEMQKELKIKSLEELAKEYFNYPSSNIKYSMGRTLLKEIENYGRNN